MSTSTSPSDSSELSSPSDNDLPSASRAKKISDAGSPVTTETEPGSSSEYVSSSDSDQPLLGSTSKLDERPGSVEIEPGSWDSDSPSSDLDGIDEGLVLKLLGDTVDRARRVLERSGDLIDASLTNALQQYIETAKAMQEGKIKKNHVLAMIEYVEPLLASMPTPREVEKSSGLMGVSSRSAKPRTSKRQQWLFSPGSSDSSLQSDCRGSSSNVSTPEVKQHSPRLVELLADVGTAEVESASPTNSPGRRFRAAPDSDALDPLGLEAYDGTNSTEPEVFLNVYDVGVLAPSVHKVLATLGTGAYHVGVEIYGREFSYGNSTTQLHPDATGVSMQPVPRKHPFHQYCGTIRLGQTALSPCEVNKLIEELQVLWLARKYHTLRNNCVSFAEDFCTRLGVEAPPEHVGSLAKGLKGFLWN